MIVIFHEEYILLFVCNLEMHYEQTPNTISTFPSKAIHKSVYTFPREKKNVQYLYEIVKCDEKKFRFVFKSSFTWNNNEVMGIKNTLEYQHVYKRKIYIMS